MKRALRLLLWPGSLILLVVALLSIDIIMVVLSSRSTGEPPAITTGAHHEVVEPVESAP